MFWITTALDIDDSLGNVSVNTNWTYIPPGGNETSSNTTAYIVGCSLNATTILDVLDVQSNILVGTSTSQFADSPSQLWTPWTPGGTTALGTEVWVNIFIDG